MCCIGCACSPWYKNPEIFILLPKGSGDASVKWRGSFDSSSTGSKDEAGILLWGTIICPCTCREKQGATPNVFDSHIQEARNDVDSSSPAAVMS